MKISKSASTNCPRFPESSKRVGPACFYTSVCPVLKRPGQHSGNQYLSGRLGRLCRAGNRVEAQQVLAGRPEILPWSDYVEATADTKTPPSKHTQNCNFLYKTHALTFLKVKKSYHFCQKTTTCAKRSYILVKVVSMVVSMVLRRLCQWFCALSNFATWYELA